MTRPGERPAAPAPKLRGESPAAGRAASAARRGRHAERRRWLLAAAWATRRRAPDAWMPGVRAVIQELIDEGAYVDAVWLVEALWRREADPRARLHLAANAATVALAAGRLRTASQWVESAAALAGCLELADPARATAAEVRAWRVGSAGAAVVPDPRGGGATAIVWRRAMAAQRAVEADDERGARALLVSPLRPARARGLPDLALATLRVRLGIAGRAERQWVTGWLNGEAPLGWVRWGQRERTMTDAGSMAELLIGLREASSDVDALGRIAAWAARDTGGRVTAASRDGCVVVGPAWAVLGAAVDRVAMALAAPPGVVVDPDGIGATGRVLVWATVADGGRTAGVIVAASPAWRSTVAHQCLLVAAALAGPYLTRIGRASPTSEGLDRAIIGVSPAILAIRAAAARAAAVPFAVVIEGESGTGKEVVARAVHQLGPRARQPFVAINCAALPDELAEAELFGHAKGAFTHAVAARAGLFEDAHHGTLFLDEVGELTPRVQAKLLRALQEGEVRRVGETAPRPVDVRVLAASNQPIDALVAAGRFREDLFFRLSVMRLRLPPLRDRLEDVVPLAEAFWTTAARAAGTRAALGADALVVLTGQAWPGNVRQLQNAMAAIAVAAPAAGRVTAALVTTVLGDAAAPTGAVLVRPLDQARREVERRLVSAAIRRHPARVDAARALGLSRQGLEKAIRRLGLAARRAGAGVA